MQHPRSRVRITQLAWLAALTFCYVRGGNVTVRADDTCNDICNCGVDCSTDCNDFTSTCGQYGVCNGNWQACPYCGDGVCEEGEANGCSGYWCTADCGTQPSCAQTCDDGGPLGECTPGSSECGTGHKCSVSGCCYETGGGGGSCYEKDQCSNGEVCWLGTCIRI